MDRLRQWRYAEENNVGSQQRFGPRICFILESCGLKCKNHGIAAVRSRPGRCRMRAKTGARPPKALRHFAEPFLRGGKPVPRSSVRDLAGERLGSTFSGEMHGR
jgi:hypothetical protein